MSVYRFHEADLKPTFAHGGGAPVRSARVLERSQSTGCNFVDLVVVPPGAEIGVHAHGCDDEEIYVVIEGTGCMLLDGESLRVGPGDVLVNRPGGTHGLINPSCLPLRLVVIDVRAGGSTL